MKSVHDEIKSISETVTMLNIGAEDMIQRNTQGKMVANIFEMLPRGKYKKVSDYITMVEAEQVGNHNMHWFYRIDIWSFLGYQNLIKNNRIHMSDQDELTIDRLILQGRYLWNGPLYMEQDTYDLQLMRKTINEEILLVRKWTDTCPCRPYLSWQGRFLYRPNYKPCGEEMWRYLTPAWRSGQMHGHDLEQIDLVMSLEFSMGRKPTPSEVLAESVDIIHKKNLKYLFPPKPNEWACLEYESSDDY